MQPAVRLGGRAAVVLLLLASCTRNAVAPPSPETLELYVEARALYAERRFDQALALLERNQAASPGFSGNSLLIGKIHFFREQYAQAQQVWEQTLARNPHHLDTRKWLARLHLLRREPGPAYAVLSPGFADSAEDPELLILLGKTLRQQGDLAAAIEALTKAQAFAERASESYLELAEIYHGLGLTDRAREQLERAGSLLAEDSELSASIALRLTRLRQEDTRKEPGP
jgi:tetratricopeptide (TPR) repeat protein